MRKRCWLLVAGALACLVVGAIWLAWPSDPISQATISRIQDGMTTEEVETVVGCPPGVHTTRDYPLKRLLLQEVPQNGVVQYDWDPAFQTHYWFGDQGVIQVSFIDGRAREARYITDDPSLLERFQEWLGW